MNVYTYAYKVRTFVMAKLLWRYRYRIWRDFRRRFICLRVAQAGNFRGPHTSDRVCDSEVCRIRRTKNIAIKTFRGLLETAERSARIFLTQRYRYYSVGSPERGEPSRTIDSDTFLTNSINTFYVKHNPKVRTLPSRCVARITRHVKRWNLLCVFFLHDIFHEY